MQVYLSSEKFAQMIPIARPLVSGTVEREVVELIEEQMRSRTVSTGIKGCQKRILGGGNGLLVLTADTTPMDLITHLPALCEDRGVKYVFVEKKSILPNNFTCVFLEADGDNGVGRILEKL